MTVRHPLGALDGGLTGGCFGNSSILGSRYSKADSYHFVAHQRRPHRPEPHGGTRIPDDGGVARPGAAGAGEKVTCRLREEGGESAAERPTTVTIATNRGVFETSQVRPRGNPAELTEQELIEKFRANAALVKDSRRADNLAARLVGLEAVDDVRAVGELAARDA